MSLQLTLAFQLSFVLARIFSHEQHTRCDPDLAVMLGPFKKWDKV